MEKIVVVVFDDESKAHHGIRALRRLDTEGSISIHAGALIRKDDRGTTVVPDPELEYFPIRTLEGTMLGGVIGLLAGPGGFAAGSGLGAMAGLIGDMAVATMGDDLVSEVSKRLQPGKCAVLLDVAEDWITPVDTELEPYSGIIFRRAKVDIEDDLTAKRIEVDQREMDNLEKEWVQTREDRKAELHARMEELRNRTRRQAEHLKERRERIRGENETKMNALRQKVSTVDAEKKQRVQARIDELSRGDREFLNRIDRAVAALQKADLEFTERVESGIARGLRKGAEHLEGKKRSG